MEITVTERDGISILSFKGDLQFSNWQEMVNAASKLINDGKKEIVVSWDQVGYIDSSALGALVSIHKLFQRIPDGKSVIFTTREEHHFIFRQAHFHSFLDIYDDLDKAMSSFRSIESSTHSTR